MLRALFLNRDLEYHGGVSNALLNLARGHSRARADLRFGSLMNPSGAMQSAFREVGIETQIFGDRGYFKPALALRKFIHSENIDVAIVSSFKCSLIAKVATAGTRCKVVHYIHAVDGVFEGNAKRKLFAFLAKHDGILSVSKVVEQAHRPANHAGPSAVIYNGVRDPMGDSSTQPYPRSFRRELGIPDDALLIGYIGAFVACKNHGTLLKALEMLDPKLNAHLILIGKSEPGSTVEQQVASMKDSGRVHIVAPRPDARRILGAMDIYVHPGREGFGLAVVEAMLAGKPVVAARDGALVEFVQDGITGLLAEAHDPQSFAAKVDSIARDPALAQRLAESGRVASLKQFSVNGFAGQMCDYLNEIVASNRSAAHLAPGRGSPV